MLTKKLSLIITVVLALAPLAQGGFQIGTRYLDDRPFDPDTDVLDIGESLYLSIFTDEREQSSLSGYFWALVCDFSLASITDGEAGPDAYYVKIWGPASVLWDVPGSVPEGEDGRVGEFGYDLYAIYPPGLYADNFLYSPMAVGDVTVRFLELDASSGEIWSVPDSIVIHQIPEPMTIILLGLDGLFLRRGR